MTEETHEVRTLRWKVKQLGKQLGKQGETIHHLRGENAALRRMLSYSPGDLARTIQSNHDLRAEARALKAENAKLREALDDRKTRIPSIGSPDRVIGGQIVGGGGGFPGGGGIVDGIFGGIGKATEERQAGQQ